MPFGQKMVIFMIPLNLFKGLLYCTGTFLANFYNGYSGIALYQDYYYALHPVLLTTITVCAYLSYDNSVSRDNSKFTFDSLQSTAHTSPSYNPT
jgi:hypothetical protein